MNEKIFRWFLATAFLATVSISHAQQSKRVFRLAEELVGLKADIIVADSYSAARYAKKVSPTIPIIMASGADLVATGLAASLARPGGNVTGLTNITPELLGKRLELLKEVVPKVSRFAVLDSVTSVVKPMFKNGQAAAEALGVKLQLVEVNIPIRISRAHSEPWPKNALAVSSQAQAFSVRVFTEKRFWS